MMNKKLYLLPVLLMVIALVSCDETEDNSNNRFVNWKERNIAFIDSLQHVYDAKTDPELMAVKDSRDERVNIFYKVLEEGDQTQERPKLTSTANVYYRGMYINESIFYSNTEKYYTRLYKDLDVFKQNFSEDDPRPEFEMPTSWVINSNIVPNGIKEILMHMYPGARWEIYVPYNSAIGSNDLNALEFTTFIYDLILIDFYN